MDETIRNMFPFAFPGGVDDNQVVESPPLHDDLRDFGFFELYSHIFEQMKAGEKIIDMLKRFKNENKDLDDAAKYISELYTRGETDIFDRDWIFIAMSAGKIGEILSTKWEVNVENEITGPFGAEELAPKARVLGAQDATVRITGTDEWVPIEKINFSILKL